MSKKHNQLIIMPLIGIFWFFVTTGIAMYHYPGGSSLYPDSSGFHIIHNYWCDLLRDIAKNGEPNTAKPWAIAAMIIFSFGKIFFWYFLPQILDIQSITKKIIQFSGMTSMCIVVFIFTDFHDLVLVACGLLTGIALTFSFIALYKSRLYRLLAVGLICVIISIFNYTLYFICYNDDEILDVIMPTTQKLGMLSYILWTGMACWAVYKRELGLIRTA